MIRRLAWTDLPLGAPAVPSGEMVLHRSLTSGLTRRAGDPPNVFWGVGDRGPNIKPRDAARRYGLNHLEPLAALDGAKIMPMSEIGPALARFRLKEDYVVLEAVMPMKATDGHPLNGLPPVAAPGAETEPVFALDGSSLRESALGADSEGIAPGPDGMFWIAEEYGPSLLLVDETGVVHRRVIPVGSEIRFVGSPIPLTPILPEIATARRLNRGFEALALRPDGKSMVLAFQSPLAHPDRAAHDCGTLLRIWELDGKDCSFQGEYAYPIDPPQAFGRDREAGLVAQCDVKVSELAFHPDGSLLVLERVTLSTHIYRVRLTEELPPHFIKPDHRPSLEQLGLSECSANQIPLLAKEKLFSTDDHPEICGDLEGMIVLEGGDLLLSNDSDYGTEGAVTQFWRVFA